MGRSVDRPGPARPGEASAQDTRERILDAAQDLFAQHGFDATPTARVAAVAHVPKGLLFYYFPKKIDILLTLLSERLPLYPLCEAADVVRSGDLAGSLLRLARRLKLGEHRSTVLRTIIHREASTHPEVRDRVSALREHLLDLTGEVLDAATSHALDPRRRRNAAEAFVGVMIAEANLRQLGAPTFDLAGAAEIIADGLLTTSPDSHAPGR